MGAVHHARISSFKHQNEAKKEKNMKKCFKQYPDQFLGQKTFCK